MISEETIKAVRSYNDYIRRHGINPDVVSAYGMAARTAIEREKDVEHGLPIARSAKLLIEELVKRKTGGMSMWDLEKYSFKTDTPYELLDDYYDMLLFEAQNQNLDSYLQYLERKRVPEERFYMPKRKQFQRIGVTGVLQDMLDDKCDILCISLIPGSGKTTLSKFFISGVVGWFPKDFNLFFSHSADIARMYYDGALDIVSNAEEYAWKDVFPKLKVTSQNAKMQTFNIGKYKPFASLQCTSRSSNNAGVVRASKFLMVDDLVAGIEEALNKNTLDKLWNIYSVDARQRKIEGCKEIIIATRWSVHDVIGRIQRLYPDNPRVRFLAVPDIDPVTGESNFDYEFDGFTVSFFHDQELAMDDISYKCLYKQEPIEREGLLYHDEELRRYLELPDTEPDAIWGICDVKNKGTDFMFLPCVKQYGDEYYLTDCVCDDSSDFGYQEDKCANLIHSTGMQQCQFESNAGGDRFAENVNKKLAELGGRCNITTKPTETNKETKIIVNADWIKKHVIFRDKSLYTPKSDYGTMMNWLVSYSIAGKNVHDDVPDGLAMLALFVTAKARVVKVEAVMNPFMGLSSRW